MVGLSRGRGRGRGGRVLWPNESSTSTHQTHPPAERQTITRSHNTPLQNATLLEAQTLTQRTTSRSHLPNQPLPGPNTRTPGSSRSHPPLIQTQLEPQSFIQRTTRSHPNLQTHTLAQTQCFSPQLNSNSPVEEHDSNSSPIVHEFEQYGSGRPEEESLDDAGEEFPDHVHTPEEESSGRRVRTRGPTRCLSNVTSEAKKIIYLHNGRAVAGESDKGDQDFVSQVMVWAKHSNNIPLQVKDFKDIPKETLIRFWDYVQETYELHPNDEHQRDRFFQWIGDRYRNRRAKLKKEYLKYNTDAQRKRNPPIGVNNEDWEYLVSLFGSEEKKVQSERNSINIENSQSSHSVGTVSFGRLRHREEKETGVEPNLLEFYKKTHTKKDGTAVSEDAAQKMKQMDELKEQVSEGVCSYTDTEIFRISVGPDTRGRTKGHGRIPASEVYSTRRRTRADLERELEEQRLQHQRNEAEQRKKYEEELSAVRNQVNDISNNLREQMQLELREQMRLELQEQMHAFMEKMRGGALYQPPTNQFEDDNVNGEMRNNDGGTS